MSGKPWEAEPNELKWVDPGTRLTCLIIRTGMGHLCGYVRIPRSSRLYVKKQRRAAINKLRVHGGVTFDGGIRRGGGGKLRGRWIGFDCAHFGDLVPKLLKYGLSDDNIYRDIGFVKRECERLAVQIKRTAK